MEMYTIVHGTVYCQFCSSQCSIFENREGARAGIKRSADKMIKASVKKFKQIDIGSSVVVQIPKIDRSPLDQPNIIGKVLDFSNNLYRVGTKHGIINTWLTRNCIDCIPFVFTDTVPNRNLSLREISAKSSDHGGQGFKKCNCRSRCITNRCQCHKNNMKCNSRCHPSHACSNKC